jgi:hypothetical protein
VQQPRTNMTQTAQAQVDELLSFYLARKKVLLNDHRVIPESFLPLLNQLNIGSLLA